MKTQTDKSEKLPGHLSSSSYHDQLGYSYRILNLRCAKLRLAYPTISNIIKQHNQHDVNCANLCVKYTSITQSIICRWAYVSIILLWLVLD